MIYSGDRFPAWKGDALIPALSGEALIRVDINGDRAAKADHWPMGARIREVEQGPDGEVYLLEDGESGGRLLRLDPARAAGDSGTGAARGLRAAPWPRSAFRASRRDMAANRRDP